MSQNKEHQSNRQAWNEAAAHYRDGLDSSVTLLKNGGSSLCPIEIEHLNALNLQSKTCVHLQCAGGTDSLSLFQLGAREVIGVDISEEMLKVAVKKSGTLGLNARWVRSDVLEIPESFNGVADFIYTGKGALIWMMDIAAWGKVVARVLKPGGAIYIFEGHPFTYVFEMSAKELVIDPKFTGYFVEAPYQSQDWPATYVGKVKANEADQAVKYEKPWPVSAVVTALIEAGLVIEKFEEHPDKYWNEFANLPETLRTRFPNTYSIVARRPSE